MQTRQTILTELNETITQFIAACEQLPDPEMKISEGWNARDVAAHITFWHESFARNVEDLAHERKPRPLKGRLGDLNRQGVEAMRGLSLEAVLERLAAAHRVIQAHILDPRLEIIPYRKGSRDYSPEEHLEIVRDHIRAHGREIQNRFSWRPLYLRV